MEIDVASTTYEHKLCLDNRNPDEFRPVEVEYRASMVNEHLLNTFRRTIMSQIPTFVVDDVFIHGANIVDLLDHVSTMLRRMTWVYKNGYTVPWKCIRQNIGFKLKFSVSYENHVKTYSTDDNALSDTAQINGRKKRSFLVDHLSKFCTSFQPWDFDKNIPISNSKMLQASDLKLIGCGTTLFTLFEEGNFINAELHIRCMNATHHPLWDVSVGVAIRRVPHIYFSSENQPDSILNYQDRFEIARSLVEADEGGGITPTNLLIEYIKKYDDGVVKDINIESITCPKIEQLVNIDPRRVSLSQSHIKMFSKHAGLCVDFSPVDNNFSTVILRIETTGAYTPLQLWHHSRQLIRLHLKNMRCAIASLERK